MLLVCYFLLYVVALCVKMRCVILCIKRLLIGRLKHTFKRIHLNASEYLNLPHAGDSVTQHTYNIRY